MRIRARLLLGMFGLVLVVPTIAAAAPQGGDDAGYAASGGQTPSQPAPHHHKGLFGRRHCVECQRAYVKAHDGVDIAAPPSSRPVRRFKDRYWPPRLVRVPRVREAEPCRDRS